LSVGKGGSVSLSDKASLGSVLKDSLVVQSGVTIPGARSVSPLLRSSVRSDSSPLVSVSDAFVRKDVLSLLELSLELRLEIVLFAGDWSDDVISSLIINKCRGGVSLAAVVVPGFGRSRSLLLGRIANLLLLVSARVDSLGLSSSSFSWYCC
jgi:chaperonin GroEL